MFHMIQNIQNIEIIFQASSSTQAFVSFPVRRVGNHGRHRWQQSVNYEGQISTETHRKRFEALHQGVCDLPYLPLSRHDLEQGDSTLFPSVHDLSFEVLGLDHQDWFPGCHRKEVGHQSQAVIVSIFFVKLMLFHVPVLQLRLINSENLDLCCLYCAMKLRKKYTCNFACFAKYSSFVALKFLKIYKLAVLQPGQIT